MHSKYLATARATIVATSALLGASVAHAQFNASVTGTVMDPQGAVIPGATLTLTDEDNGKVFHAVTNGSGVYTFPSLAADHYTLVAVMTGFASTTVNALRVNPEESNNVNVKLELATSNTTVTVNADTLPGIETTTATISGTVTSNEIQHLPSAGRDVFQLAQLAPGSFGDGAQGSGGGTSSLPGTQGPGGAGGGSGPFTTENGPQTLANGGQYETNGITIDGISTASATWGGTSVITPNEDSVDTVRIASNAFDASEGRFSGAQIQVTSKSGTNQFHGSLFFRANRPGLNAYQRYNGPGSLASGTPAERGLVRNTSRYNDIGGSVGGPIWKDRIFGFFAYETVRDNSSSTSNGWYETPAFDGLTGGPVAGKFTTFAGHSPSNASLIAETCATAGFVEGTNCNTVAGSGLDIGSPIKTGVGAQDLGWTGAANPGVGGGLDGVADIAHYQTSTPSSSTNVQYNGRLDGNATQKDHLTFAIYWVPTSSQFYNGPARAYNLYNHSQINEAYTGIWNHTFSPKLLNEARVADSGWRWNEVASNPQEPFGLPEDNIDNEGGESIQFFGAPGPSVFNQHTYQFRDIVTKIAGNHTIRMGAENSHIEYLDDPTYAARPQYNFYNIWDFLNDAPHAESGRFNRFTGTPDPNRFDDRENLWGAFIQDDWKVSPSLTVNLGLRYTYNDALYTKQNSNPTVRFGAGASTFTNMSQSIGGHLWNPQRGNFGPELGFAYSPAVFHNKAVIRGGYGLNYNGNEFAIMAQYSNNPSNTVTPNYTSGSPTTINPNIVYAVPSDSKTLFGYPSNPNTITSYNAANLPTTTGLGLTAFPTNLKTAYSEHYSLDTQIDLGRQLVASVGYQGSVSHHLISQENAYVYGAYQGWAFNPQITQVAYYGDFAASNYNALLVGLKHEMSHNFTLNADFTYSKSMDDGSGPYEEDPYPYNQYYARGRSDFNFGKALKVYGLWQPVFFRGSHSWLEKVVGGWSLSGIFNYHSGFPWTPVSNGSNAYYDQSGYGTLRPASYNGLAKRDTSNTSFKPTAGNVGGPSPNFAQGGLAYFTKPTYTTGTYPNVGSFPTPGIARNSFTGPHYMDLDGTLAKSFGLPHVRGLGEHTGLEIRADAFNFLNNSNLNPTDISNDISATNLGVVRSALGARVVNLQARFSF